MQKRIFAILVLMCAMLAAPVFSQTNENVNAEDASGKKVLFNLKPIAAGLAVGLACIGGGIAVGKIGAAAMGAMSEDASLSGKALPFVGLAEGICLWGFLIAFLLIN